MGRKAPTRERVKQTFADAGLQSLYSQFTPEGQLRCVQRLTFEGSAATSGGNTRARVYIEGHGYKLHIHEVDAPGANTLYSIVDPFWLMPRERMCLEWDEGQAGSVQEMHLIGYWADLNERPPI